MINILFYGKAILIFGSKKIQNTVQGNMRACTASKNSITP